MTMPGILLALSVALGLSGLLGCEREAEDQKPGAAQPTGSIKQAKGMAAAASGNRALSPPKVADSGPLLPEEVTRAINNGDLATHLERARVAGEVLLLDRIAWTAREPDIARRAEDALKPFIKAYQTAFLPEAEGGRAKVPAGGAVMAKVTGWFLPGDFGEHTVHVHAPTIPEGMSLHPFLTSLELRRSPLAGVLPRPNADGLPAPPPSPLLQDQMDFTHEFAVSVGTAVAPGTYSVDMVVAVGNRGLAKDRLTIEVRQVALRREDILGLYALISSCHREAKSLLSSADKETSDALKAALGDQGGADVYAALQASQAASRKLASAKALLARALLLNGSLLAWSSSKDREVCGLASQCRLVIEKKWREWGGLPQPYTEEAAPTPPMPGPSSP